MKKVIICALLVVFAMSVSADAGCDLSSFKVNPNDQVIVNLLWLVISDLEMCGRSLNQSLIDSVSAIGHLNNAQSALRRTDLDPAYLPLMKEVHGRIGKIKFYLVMNDNSSVVMRLSQLISVVKCMLGVQTGSTITGTTSGTVFSNPQSGYVPPVRIPEIPVGNFGGRQTRPSSGPGGLVPTN